MKMIAGQLQEPENEKPLLTIAIPTYNRAHCLRQSLDVLFDQLVDEPRVELIVSDNASPDETAAVVKDFVDRGLKIRYFHNATNLGADANILQCFEQARGKYVWVVGDDDVLAVNAIDVVMTCLNKDEYDLVYLDCYFFEGLQTPRSRTSRRKIATYTDRKRFARKIHVFFTYLSGNIVNKDRVSANCSFLSGTHLVQLGWIYTALNGFTRGLYIHEKLVGMRVNNNIGGYNLLHVFGPTFSCITSTWLDSHAVQKTIINGTLQRFWPGMLLNYRLSSGTFVTEAAPYKVLASVYKDNPRFWIFAYPMLTLPISLAKCWFNVLRIVNMVDRVFWLCLQK
jgi:abequosyltransferase